MTHITLVRHGQANSAARDEISYDRLSPLGVQQSGWLGAYLRETANHHTRLYCGTLVRHRQTVDALGLEMDVVQDPRLNELEFFTLARLIEAQHGLSMPTAREGFVGHLPKVFAIWREGRVEDAPETWEAFNTRVAEAVAEIQAGDGPALVVTSGGLIAMAMSQMMGLDLPAMARMALAIMNTSMHRVFPIGDHLTPVLFNAVPHLEAPDRQFAKTHL